MMHKCYNAFLLEKRLRKLDPKLHRRFTDTVFVMHNTLSKFRRLFPEYTDHSVFHSLNVVEFCNKLIGPEQIMSMNADELYVLLMACYLHDSGMSITQKDYNEFKEGLGEEEYFRYRPENGISEFVRDYHHEFSGKFIRKYAEMLEIPTEEMVYAIVQVSRGHRRTDLFDEEEYPEALDMKDGQTVCLPYLAALLRLADEVDVVADRNPKLLYDIESLTNVSDSVQFHRMLAAVPRMDMIRNGFVVYTDTKDDTLYAALYEQAEKMQRTLDLCRSVAEKRSPYSISQEWVQLKRI